MNKNKKTIKLEAKDRPAIFKGKKGGYRIRTNKDIAPSLETMFKKLER